jgi:hypothetical protein
MANLPEIIASIAEAAEWFKTGGISVAGRAALDAYLKKRSNAAQTILFDELSSSRLLPEQVATQDDGIAVIHSYLRAAWDGRARVNLRLLAKAIVGQLQAGNLVADEFFLYSNALADLTRDEILLLAEMYKMHLRFEKDPPADGGRGFWNACIAEVVTALGWSEDKVRETAGSCLRSGFVIAESAWGSVGFRISPRFLHLRKTVDFEDAICREP